MRYHIAPFGCRPWTLNGFPDRLLVSHYEQIYGGAVRDLNAVTERLEALDLDATPAFTLRGMKREELAAVNSMILHELYFASLGGDGRVTDPMRQALEESFRSLERWRTEFTAMARALEGASGWVLLVFLPREGRLANQLAVEHSQGATGGVPLIALGMYEHAYHSEFGANALPYVDAFMRNLDWSIIESRYSSAMAAFARETPTASQEPRLPSVSVEQIKEMLERGEAVQLIDARPRHYWSKARDMMARATWRDPERVGEWAATLSKTEPVLVYCAYGFHVGCGVTAALRADGFDARYIEGGLSAWKAIGGPRQPGPDA